MNNNANQIKTTGIIAIMLISSLTVMVAVSYTHLDVYKRQLLSRAQ